MQRYVFEVHHVGSTAIPGIAATPVIDIMGLLRRHEEGFARVSAMAALGYEFRGEAGVSRRHYFRKGEPDRHHVHLFQFDHPEVGRHIRFRDYLRQHPKEASAYEALKRNLAALSAVTPEAIAMRSRNSASSSRNSPLRRPVTSLRWKGPRAAGISIGG
jgi:GrpB-like predicted nucleotidyltransferase (UPF0157 family)